MSDRRRDEIAAGALLRSLRTSGEPALMDYTPSDPARAQGLPRPVHNGDIEELPAEGDSALAARDRFIEGLHYSPAIINLVSGRRERGESPRHNSSCLHMAFTGLTSITTTDRHWAVIQSDAPDICGVLPANMPLQPTSGRRVRLVA